MPVIKDQDLFNREMFEKNGRVESFRKSKINVYLTNSFHASDLVSLAFSWSPDVLMVLMTEFLSSSLNT